MKILLAITCYRCEKQIPRVLEALLNSDLYPRLDQVIAIDNQSPDSTREQILAFIRTHSSASKIQLYANQANYGLGGSQKIAMKLASEGNFDLLCVLHGDDQANIQDLAPMIASMEEHPEYSAVLGSRFMPGSKLHGYQKSRIIGNRILNWVFTGVTGRQTRDLGSGLNLFRVRYLRQISETDLSNDFSFNVDLLLNLYRLNLPLCFQPIQWTETDQSSNARNWSVAWGMLKRLFRWKLRLKNKVDVVTRISTSTRP